MTKEGSCQDIVKIATTSSQRTQELHWMIRPVGITTEDKPGFLDIVQASMKPPLKYEAPSNTIDKPWTFGIPPHMGQNL